MENHHQTNSNNHHQTTNIKLYNFCNSRQIVKLFFFIVYHKYYFFIRYPTNHLNSYVKNYINKTYNYYKYPIIIHNNNKNLKNDIKMI